MQSQIPEEIKARLKIEEVVGSYVPLRRAGRIFKGLCPFHQEKTPSFSVNPERGIFKCFGCGEGGDIFAFVMKLEGLSFPEALELLAQRAGVVYEKPSPKGHSSSTAPEGVSKPRLFALNQHCATLWHKILLDHPSAQPALQYLTQTRGLTLKTIQQFELGFAPPAHTTLEKLKQAGYTPAEIKAAGEPGKFQHRITFPIHDITGKVVGFTGRIFGPTAEGPKYWNTPETPIFAKSRTVFALHLAKNAITQAGFAILAEGQMDVIALHQAGYTQAVASSGTALTVEQLHLIGRFSDALAMAYDSDAAGQKAVHRGLELALEAELTPYVITIPEGKDPADCLQTNPTAWAQAVAQKPLYMDWLLHSALPEGHFLDLPLEKQKQITKELLHWSLRMSNAAERESWIRKLSAYLQTSESALNSVLQGLGHSTPPAKTALPAQASTLAKTEISQIIATAATAAALLYTVPEIGQSLSNQYLELANILNRKDKLSQMGNPLLSGWLYTVFVKEMISPERLNIGSPVSIPNLQQMKDRLPFQLSTQLELAAEESLQPYADQDLDAVWAAAEAVKLLHRIRSVLRDKEKERLAESIKQAQERGDQEAIKQLFNQLRQLV
ncbi:MAG: DNA primase [Methanothrix sp.]